MEANESAALLAFAESVRDSVLALNGAITALMERVDAELAEIRDGLVELDHTKARRRDLEELGSRVDALLPRSDALGPPEGRHSVRQV